MPTLFLSEVSSFEVGAGKEFITSALADIFGSNKELELLQFKTGADSIQIEQLIDRNLFSWERAAPTGAAPSAEPTT